MCKIGRFSKLFQHTAARRRLASILVLCIFAYMFQHTAARRRLGGSSGGSNQPKKFQHTAARRRLGNGSHLLKCTHSLFQHTAARRRLVRFSIFPSCFLGFNTQPPEGGWVKDGSTNLYRKPVSTHSRPKAAGNQSNHFFPLFQVSTHSRPKAAGNIIVDIVPVRAFQHTAARRRLAKSDLLHFYRPRFNTQPPEGGWFGKHFGQQDVVVFQHTAARRRLVKTVAVSVQD